MRKIIRIVWIIYYRLYFFFLKIPYGKSMRICNHIYLKLGRTTVLNIGDNFVLSSGFGYNPLARNIKGAIVIENGARIDIGNNVGISSSCLWIYDSLQINDGVKIGGDCIILDSDAHSLNYKERRSGQTDRTNAKKEGIIIREDVLIGTRCIILKGVTIGTRSIIGSGSVVTKDIPPDEIWAGNPARFVKKINQ